MDLEDGYKHNIISYKKISNLFKSIIEAPSGKSNFNSIDKIDDKNEKIGYLRAKVITSLVNQVAEKFIEKEQEILKGEFDGQLINYIESKDEMDEIDELSEDKIYNQNEVLQIEAAGFKVLPGLLHNFIMAIKDDKNRKYKKIKKLIPDEYILDYEKKPYEAIMSITEYVAGMTDNFAVDLYRNISGIELPNY